MTPGRGPCTLSAMKVVHAADLHIDSPLRGLSRHEGLPAEDVRSATRKAFVNLVDLCIEQGAAILLLAGDIFDGQWRDFNTGVFFVRQLARLRQSHTRVVMLHGNHDAESPLTDHIPLPSHVDVLPSDRPHSVVYDELGVAVHGRSYPHRVVDENLARDYPKPLRGYLNIGLLHTNATGSTDHGNYAPCTVKQLVRHGYHYWALGHVHQRAILHRDPWVVYPGNLQGRHARETGEKGCMIIELAGQRVVGAEFCPLDVLRWFDLTVELGDADDLHAVDNAVRQSLQEARLAAGERAALVRVRLAGKTKLHGQLAGHPEVVATRVRAVAADVGRVYPEKILLQTQPVDAGGPVQAAGLAGALRKHIENLASDEQALKQLGGELAALATSVAAFVDVRPDQPAQVRQHLSEVETLLLSRLAGALAAKAPADRVAPTREPAKPRQPESRR